MEQIYLAREILLWLLHTKLERSFAVNNLAQLIKHNLALHGVSEINQVITVAIQHSSRGLNYEPIGPSTVQLSFYFDALFATNNDKSRILEWNILLREHSGDFHVLY